MSKKEECLAQLQAGLKIDCEKCSGLCCVALYCAKTDGFPENKEAGIPCKHLEQSYRCKIHSKLSSKNMRGCTGYDCFGAGQKVTQKYENINYWTSDFSKKQELFSVFLVVFQLHQMQWYLLEALSCAKDESMLAQIQELMQENEQMTDRKPSEVLKLDVESYRSKVNGVLKEVCNHITSKSSVKSPSKDFFGKDFKKASLNGRDFSMALMIAANLEGCTLRHANFLGADLRDANIKNADLSQSLFLTQMQINSAKGNDQTKLPNNITRPASW